MTAHVSCVSGLDARQVRDVRDHFRHSGLRLPTIDYHIDDRGQLIRATSSGWAEWDSRAIATAASCRACSVHRDLIRCLDQYASSGWDSDLLVTLPPGVSGTTVLDAVEAVPEAGPRPVGYAIGSIMTVIDPGTLTATLRSTETLAEKGFCLGYGDLTCGRLLVEDLLLSDCYILAHDGPDRAGLELGVELAHHLAPQSRATALTSASSAGPLPLPTLEYRFDQLEVTWRASAGAVVMPLVADGRRVRTHLASTRRPLHPARLRAALGELTAGSVWARGRIWAASVPDRKFGMTVIGHCVDFADGGPWLADRPGSIESTTDTEGLLNWQDDCGDRGTWLAFTGEAVDPARIDACLAGCELTDDELGFGAARWRELDDPLQLRSVICAHCPNHQADPAS
ncbi:GTP-binding protein [Microlunatus speluncae]|uniref:GTP-binding protein n=1 Tax=Microlunatus speluncae TaxID=2594267 RepID=UPI00126607E6|nr:GTP-binding protein [Microlunatus speluncae]